MRKKGWSTDDEKNEIGTRCVGASVFDYQDRLIASISVAWAITAHPDLVWNDMTDHVHKYARNISIKMGYISKKPFHLLKK